MTCGLWFVVVKEKRWNFEEESKWDGYGTSKYIKWQGKRVRGDTQKGVFLSGTRGGGKGEKQTESRRNKKRKE